MLPGIIVQKLSDYQSFGFVEIAVCEFYEIGTRFEIFQGDGLGFVPVHGTVAYQTSGDVENHEVSLAVISVDDECYIFLSGIGIEFYGGVVLSGGGDAYTAAPYRNVV